MGARLAKEALPGPLKTFLFKDPCKEIIVNKEAQDGRVFGVQE